MSATSTEFYHCLSAEQRLLDALHTRGPQTLEELAFSCTDVSWSQVFLAVDHLSRAGAVSLLPLRRCEYQVSLTRVTA